MEIAAFLLTCLLGRMITVQRLAGFDHIFISPAQYIMKIYIVQFIHYAMMSIIFWWKQVGMW
jgi:hypothetical protein